MKYFYFKSNKKNYCKGIIITNILVILSMICLGVLYLYQNASLVKDTYKIREYRKNISELKKQNQILEEKLFELSSLDKLQEMVKPLNMAEVKKVVYLKKEVMVQR